MSTTPAIDVDALFRSHARRAFALAFQITGCAHLADDVVQQSFLAAHRHAQSFRHTATPSTWLYRIVVRDAVRARTVRAREPRVNDTLIPREAGCCEVPATTCPAPIDVLAAQDTANRIMEAMDHLLPEHRLALVLLQVLDLPAPDIAEMPGVPINTVYTRAFHARRRRAPQSGATRANTAPAAGAGTGMTVNETSTCAF